MKCIENKNSISKIIKNVNLTIPCTDSEIYFFNKTILNKMVKNLQKMKGIEKVTRE